MLPADVLKYDAPLEDILLKYEQIAGQEELQKMLAEKPGLVNQVKQQAQPWVVEQATPPFPFGDKLLHEREYNEAVKKFRAAEGRRHDMYLSKGHIEFRQNVRKRLRASGLAYRILDLYWHGQYYASLPQPLGYWARVMRPRSVEQAARHMARNAEWYLLAPQGGTPPNAPRFSLTGCSLFILLCGAVLLIGPTSLPGYAALVGMLVSGGILLYSLALLAKHAEFVSVSAGEKEYSFIPIEFYFYLCEAYADVKGGGQADHGQA